MTAAISCDGVVKRFGTIAALDGLGFEVPAGKVVGYLGPNGAGKSTTIRILLDLARPDAGTVRVLGHDPRTTGPELRLRVGYLPGELRLDDRLRVDETLRSWARIRGDVDEQHVATLCERLSLDPTRHTRPLEREPSQGGSGGRVHGPARAARARRADRRRRSPGAGGDPGAGRRRPRRRQHRVPLVPRARRRAAGRRRGRRHPGRLGVGSARRRRSASGRPSGSGVIGVAAPEVGAPLSRGDARRQGRGARSQRCRWRQRFTTAAGCGTGTAPCAT